MSQFEGNTGTSTLTTDEWVWDEASGKMVPSGRKTSRQITETGKDNTVGPVKLGGIGQSAAKGWADQWGKQQAPWRKDFADKQQDYINQLRDRAAGVAGPSIAENQLTAGNDAAGRAQQSLALSTRGSGGLANAGYNAQQQQSLGSQQTANQQVQLQAQQQQQAQQQYAGQLNAVRGQNAQQVMQDAQRQQDMVKFYTQLGFDEQQANLMAQQQIDQLNSEVWWQKLGFATQEDALKYKREQQGEADTRNMVNAGLSAAGAGFAAAGTSDERVKTKGKNVQKSYSQSRSDSDPYWETLRLLQEEANIPEPVLTKEWPKEQGSSDRRFKSKLRDSDEIADSFLDALKKSRATYSYTDPKYDTSTKKGSRYLGIMAQDVEKVPEIGKGIVSEVGGVKRVETLPMLSAVSGALGRLTERLEKVEGRRGR